MAEPPRPPRPGVAPVALQPAPRRDARELSPDEVDVPVSIPPAAAQPSPPESPAEIDAATRELLATAIARAITASLGRVRISSIPPDAPTVGGKTPSEPPRSSIRVAAKGTGKLGKWGTMAVGGLAITGQIIVWFGKPEYAGPIAQALKLIASMLVSLAGGGAPSGEASPP